MTHRSGPATGRSLVAPPRFSVGGPRARFRTSRGARDQAATPFRTYNATDAAGRGEPLTVDSTFDVVFASDDRYAPHLAAAIHSLLQWNRGRVSLHVITGSVSDETREGLQKVASGFSAPLQFHVVPEGAFEGLALPRYVSKAAYYRLMIPDLIAGRRALYLDCDLVVNAPLDSLFAADLRGHGLAAVEDAHSVVEPFHERLGMREGARYFNSGVMLMDLDVWRTSGWRTLVGEVVGKRPHAIRYADQCGLNAVVNGDWSPLAPKWNQQTLMHEWTRDELAGYCTPDAVDEALRSPAVVHFTGPSKPWHADNVHPMRALYWRHRAATPFSPRRPPFSARRLVKLATPRAVKRWYWASRR